MNGRRAVALAACAISSIAGGVSLAQEIHAGPEFLAAPLSIETSSVATPARASLTESLLERARVAGLTIAPDGGRVAFTLVRMDLDEEAYQSVLAVASADGKQTRVLGSAGPPAWDYVGNLRPMTPRWSDEGRRLALSMQVDGVRQVVAWTVDEPNAAAQREQLTYESRDVMDFDWLPERQGLRIAERVDDEYTASGRGGLRAPIRVSPTLMANYGAPFMDELKERSPPVEWRTIAAGQRTGVPLEANTLNDGFDTGFAVNAARSETVTRDRKRIASVTRGDGRTGIRIVEAVGGRTVASIELAGTFLGQVPELVGWLPSGRQLAFLWSPKFGERNLYLLDADGRIRAISPVSRHRYLSRCEVARDAAMIACVSEGPAELQTLVVFDAASGREVRLAAPNQGITALNAFSPELRTWLLNGETHHGWVIHASKQFTGPRPMVIAVYRFPGRFLDSTGEELALFDLARHGIVVVCLETPPRRNANDAFDVAIADWERPNRLFQHVVETLAQSGEIDATRVGIVGLSYGSELVAYSISHSATFAAAASGGGGSIDPTRVAYALPGAGAGYAFPGLWWWEDTVSLERWKRLSPALNANAVRTPILFQIADREAGPSFFFLGQLLRFGKPCDAWIYDRELHQKVWPSNKRAVNERNLDWFRFWLQEYEDPSLAKKDQYSRWRALVDRR